MGNSARMPHDVLYLSPHPDDAVFSSGGAIAVDVRAGLRVGVVTVFSRTPYGSEEARRDEDHRAIERLGAERIELGLLDAPLRNDRYNQPSGLLGVIGDREAALVEQVRAAVIALGARRVVAPLGVGQHVDHQIVHAAAALDGDVSFYEDVPYALEPFGVARRLARLGQGGPARGGFRREFSSLMRWWSEMPYVHDHHGLFMRQLAAFVLAKNAYGGRAPEPSPVRFIASRIDVSDVMEQKLAAIADYGSQWPLFHRSIDEWRRRLEAHSLRMGADRPAERQWKRA